MFIQDDDLIQIKVYIKKNAHRYFCYTEKEYGALEENNQKKCEIFSLKMKQLTWGLYNQLQDEAMRETNSGESKFNYRFYKEAKLKNLIKEWDAKDKDGKPVPITPANISHLSPVIAETVLRSYDEISFLTEEDEGKS